MNDQTSVVYTLSKQGLVAGLSWQPLLAKGSLRRMSEVRKSALMIDCNFYAIVKADKIACGGFDDFDEGVAKEERTVKPFSLAAMLAKAYGDVDTIVAWRVRTGARLGDVCLVVIQGGVPTLDVIVTESEAISMMEYYQQSRDRNLLFRIVSNDLSMWVADSFIEDESAFVKKYISSGSRINTIPLDYKMLLQATVGIFLLLGSLIGYDYYLVEQEKRELAALIAAQDNTAQYGAALNSRLGQVGLSTEGYKRLLNTVYDLPYYINGWAMTGIECNNSLCTMQWNSVGGYTDQLEAAFSAKDGYVVQINRASPTQISVIKDFGVPLSGPTSWAELPRKPQLDEWALDQRQVYLRSKVDINMFSEPEIWPTGYVGISQDQAVTRYRFTLKGGVAISESFINNQNQPLYWEKLNMKISNAEASGPRIELELQGAYYAY